MQPEILHPCSSCGAAIREPAMFCPECGKPLANTAREAEQPAAAVVSKTTVPQSAPTSVELAATAADPETSANKADQPDESTARHGVRERTREGLHRASHAARGALEDNVKRVEKIHHVSTAMFEEASYDPSLRFVLVALGLFVVFVILLVLSKVMG
jgi:hypothetical protein